ncbi:MAG TPA: hypothetical protein VKX39_12670 [Bryobacteraceae bacterium]|jgi:hypothetical protein|nr:hypothetical protein [Bryobacteraceae bacterium]
MKKLRLAALVFAGLTLVYFSLTPGAVAGMGYTGEEMRAGDELLTHAISLLRHDPAPGAIDWSRNGVAPLLFDLPFLTLGRAAADKNLWQDRYLALGPVFSTALLLAILFAWIERVTGRTRWSLALTLSAGFATMLWPYAYIGLETKQSLALFLAAYLALCHGTRGWLRSILFYGCCAAAISVKSTGVFLAPAVAFLIYEDARNNHGVLKRVLRPRWILGSLAVVVVFAANAYTRSLFWDRIGGTSGFLKQWMVPDAASFFLNAAAFLGSPNKGLLVYAPLTLLGLVSLAEIPAQHAPVKWFALLTLGGLVGGFSLLTDWSDETWGPRYLHSAIVPLVLCLGLAALECRARLRLALAGVILAGFIVSFLGSFFAYGSLQAVATQAGQDTLEAYQGDPVWNHIRFNEKLFEIWLKYGNSGAAAPQPWPTAHHWFYAVPPDAPPWKTVDAAPFAHPQSLMIRAWTERKIPAAAVAFWLLFSSFLLGIALLAAAARQGARKTKKPPVPARNVT